MNLVLFFGCVNKLNKNKNQKTKRKFKLHCIELICNERRRVHFVWMSIERAASISTIFERINSKHHRTAEQNRSNDFHTKFASHSRSNQLWNFVLFSHLVGLGWFVCLFVCFLLLFLDIWEETKSRMRKRKNWN